MFFTPNNLITNTLDRIGPIIAANIEDLKLDIKGVQDILGSALVASNRNSMIILSIVALIAIAIGMFPATCLTRSITAPLASGVIFAKIVEEEDLTQKIEIDQKDEVGALADAMRNMVPNLKDMVGLANR